MEQTATDILEHTKHNVDYYFIVVVLVPIIDVIYRRKNMKWRMNVTHIVIIKVIF